MQLALVVDHERARPSGPEALSHRVRSEVRECLKLDPDHKQCYSHYKKVRKLNKQILSAEELIQEQRWVCAISVPCATPSHTYLDLANQTVRHCSSSTGLL